MSESHPKQRTSIWKLTRKWLDLFTSPLCCRVKSLVATSKIAIIALVEHTVYKLGISSQTPWLQGNWESNSCSYVDFGAYRSICQAAVCTKPDWLFVVHISKPLGSLTNGASNTISRGWLWKRQSVSKRERERAWGWTYTVRVLTVQSWRNICHTSAVSPLEASHGTLGATMVWLTRAERCVRTVDRWRQYASPAWQYGYSLNTHADISDNTEDIILVPDIETLVETDVYSSYLFYFKL